MPSPRPERSERPPGSTQARFAAAIGIVLLGAAIIVAARMFGAIPLFVVGLGFVLLGLLAPAWLLIAARGAVVRREFALRRAVEDEPLEAVIHVSRGWLGLPGAKLVDPLAGTTVSVAEPLSVLSGRASIQLRVIARIPRRGRHRFAPPQLVLSDALGLAQVGRTGLGQEDEILVLPRTEPVHWIHRDHRRAATGRIRGSAHEPLGAGEMDGLREYRPGTPASRIHWPALARYPEPPVLLERRLVSELRSQPLVVLDSRHRVGGSDPELLDAAVRAAASLTLELARTGGCQLLLPGDRAATPVGPDLGAWPALHTRLALVEEEADPRRAPVLRPGMMRGPVLFVSVRLDTPAALSAAAAQAGQLILVLPKRLGERVELPASFEVSGCTGFLLRSGARRSRRRAVA